MATDTIKPKKTRGSKKTAIDAEISKLAKSLETTWKNYADGGSDYLIYKDIPTELMVDDSVEKGRKIMVSMYPTSHEIFLVRYYKPGEQSFPFGGIKIYNKTLGEYKHVYPEAVVKHKDVEYFTRTFDEYD